LGLSHCQHMAAPSCRRYDQLVLGVRQLWAQNRFAHAALDRMPSTGCRRRPSQNAADHGQRPRPSAHTNCSARVSGPPNATANLRCASGCFISTISMSGPAGSLICWPGVKVLPVTASRATAFRRRVARCGDTAVINSSDSPQSWSPIVYANGVRQVGLVPESDGVHSRSYQRSRLELVHRIPATAAAVAR